MAKISAGLVLYRWRGREIEVFLVHPGGPFWRNKNAGAWSIPKGEVDEGEDLLNAAKREFKEETGFEAPQGDYRELGTVKLKSGKVIYGWAVQRDLDPTAIKSETFSIEWPPRSGKKQKFPEVDRAGWFTLAEASKKIHPGQAEFLNRLVRALEY